MYTWHLPQSTSAFWQLKTTSDVLMHTGIWNSPPAINPSSGYLTRKVKRPFNLSARWRLRHLTESRGSGSNRHKTEEHRKLRWSQPPQDAPPTPSPSNRKNEKAGTEMASTTPGPPTPAPQKCRGYIWYPVSFRVHNDPKQRKTERNWELNVCVGR